MVVFPSIFRCVLTANLALSLFSISAAFEPAESGDALRAAVEKSLPLLERSAKTSMAERKECFTCHNQGLPILVLAAARKRGFAIDDEGLKAQLRFTADFLAKNREKYRDGRGQAGQTFMAGYALWALEQGGWPADDVTEAVVEYFLKFQADDDHWKCHTHRPPSEASHFTANFLGLQALRAFSTADQQERAAARRGQVRNWLVHANPVDTEDRVFRLRALRVAEAPAEVLETATQELLDAQQPDGGWAQTADLASDAYATGIALTALHQAGGLSADDERARRGRAFLLQAQQEDGSWHVASRSEPFQTYYESGYPHGEDQFISITAGSWATLALLLALPEVPRVGGAVP